MTILGAPVFVVLLAAGRSRRMRGEDKLLRCVEGTPLLRRSAACIQASQADRLYVVLPQKGDPVADAREQVLADLGARVVHAPQSVAGMGASLAAGVRALPDPMGAVIVALADMPDVTPGIVNNLIAAHSPAQARTIVRPVSPGGHMGHPVLFGAGWRDALCALEGDKGARDILNDATENVILIPEECRGILTDLDTPEAFAIWEKSRESRE